MQQIFTSRKLEIKQKISLFSVSSLKICFWSRKNWTLRPFRDSRQTNEHSVKISSQSTRPDYPAAPATARWLSMCLFISLLQSLHWLLGHPWHHIKSRRAGRRHDGGSVDKSGEGRTEMLPVSPTLTHTRLWRKHFTAWPQAACKAQCKHWAQKRCVCVCVCVSVSVCVCVHVSRYSLHCPDTSLLPKKTFQSPPPPCCHRYHDNTDGRPWLTV